jgi:bifunctional oligoribonuclease and PAP phosphatase NrnA
MFKHKSSQIQSKIEQSTYIVLMPHKNPDPDALGSVLALYEYIKALNKTVYMYCASEVPQTLSFLPHFDQILNKFPDKDIDLIINLDSGDIEYAGLLETLEQNNINPTIINIDHHPTNTHFGNINLVQPKASSTAEILYYFFQSLEIPVTDTMATNLLAGIISDTMNFTNKATSYPALSVTSELIKAGGQYQKIQDKLFNNKSIDMLKLWGTIFGRMQKNTKLDIVYTYITQEDLKRFHVSEEESDGLTNFLNTIDDGIAGIIFKEKKDGSIKAGLRTTYDHINVSAIALHFGGGGHKKASGCTLEGPIDIAIEKLFTTIESGAIEWKI